MRKVCSDNRDHFTGFIAARSRRRSGCTHKTCDAIRSLDRAKLDKKSIGERRRKYLVGYPAWSTPVRPVGLSKGFGFDH
jgi:hypothetical protein